MEHPVTTSVRRRSDADLPALRVLAEDVLRLDGYPPRLPQDLGRFIAAPDALAAFVAVRDGHVVGHVCISSSSSADVLDLACRALGLPSPQLAVVARLVVSPEHRRDGVARALLAEALVEVTRLGRTPILDVATHFGEAIRLYERSGWRRLGKVSVAISGNEPLDEYVYVGPMAGWHPDCYQRAVAYATDPSGRLLVFDHVDVDAGTQVPGGGVHVGESAGAAVLRELAEETGLESAVLVRKLGEAWHRAETGTVPAGLEEQVHHAFHLELMGPPHLENWEWEERSGGDVVEHRFAFRWIPLHEAEGALWPHQARWIDAVRLSLQHSV